MRPNTHPRISPAARRPGENRDLRGFAGDLSEWTPPKRPLIFHSCESGNGEYFFVIFGIWSILGIRDIWDIFFRAKIYFNAKKKREWKVWKILPMGNFTKTAGEVVLFRASFASAQPFFDMAKTCAAVVIQHPFRRFSGGGD